MISDALLQGVYLFGDLAAAQRGELTRIPEPMTLPAGSAVVNAGGPVTAFCLITSEKPAARPA